MNDVTEGRSGPAQVIFASGWRQCSIFRPPVDDMQDVPAYLKFDPAYEWLVVCTQTCSLCAENFLAEPMAEVMAATPLARFNPRHDDATGKNNKCLHVPVSGLPGCEGLACHMGRRAFVPRTALARWQPSLAWMEGNVVKSFKGWLVHHYMRVSLPDNLVERLKLPGGVRDIVMDALRADLNGAPCSTGVASFYIDWLPDEDVSPDHHYTVQLLVNCKDVETQEFMTLALSNLHATQRNGLSINGVIVTQLEIETEDNITLASLEGFHRFNEWDEVSSLKERLASMEKAI
jgi:hypothetical protein